jgi:hypothetical protein
MIGIPLRAPRRDAAENDLSMLDPTRRHGAEEPGLKRSEAE